MCCKPTAVALAVTLWLAQAPIAAQEKDAPTSQPSGWPTFARGPFVEVSVAGPKAIRQAILPTNLGARIGGAECRPLWDVMSRRFRNLLEQTDTDAEDAWAALQERLL
ncbi:MAG: hypothetical protein V3U11_01515, partial [Planctomycetota bacterium]